MALKPSSWMRYSTMPKSCDSALGPCPQASHLAHAQHPLTQAAHPLGFLTPCQGPGAAQSRPAPRAAGLACQPMLPGSWAAPA